MESISHSTAKEPTISILSILPTEIISFIVCHLYAEWSLNVLDRPIKPSMSSLAISGTPTVTARLLRTSRLINSLATQHERSSFSGKLVFTTSSTHWRTLTRLRSVSPSRMGWVIDHVSTLVFSSPPLFTSRIPYAFFRGLQRIELDYRGRSSKFRCQGQLREAEASTLAGLIVSFARDTDRFDSAIVDDAWKSRKPILSPSAAHCSEHSRDHMRLPGIEVLVVKRMSVYHHISFEMANMIAQRVEQIWDLTVIATYRGKLEEVDVEVRGGTGERSLQFKTTIWTPSEDGKHEFRDKLAAASRIDGDNLGRGTQTIVDI